MSRRWVASAMAIVTLVASGALGAFSVMAAHPGPRAQATDRKAGANSGANAAKAGADLSGVWRRSRKAPDASRKYTVFDLALAFTVDEPVMTPWAEARFKSNKPSFGARAVPYADSNDPDARCFPPGVPRVYLERGEPMEIMQVPGKVVMVFEYDHFIRQIYTDGRQHSQEVLPTWMGDSIGRWEQDTLIVDTVGFNDKTWLDMVGHPHSEGLHVVERMRRLGRDQLAIDLAIDDPKAYAKPWGGHMIFDRKADWSLGEMICEDNITFDDFQKKQRPAN